MLDTGFIYFAFIAGLVAFFAPCSFAILPGYVSYYLSNKSKAKNHFSENLLQGLIFGFIASLGFLTVFGLAGFGVLAVGQFIKRFIPWIAVITGIILIIIGFAMLLGKNISYFQLPKINLVRKNEKLGIYLFGIAYAIGSLGCVFPIFLSIVVQGIASTLLNGIYIILAYIIGISSMMLLLTAATFGARHFVLGALDKYLVYFKKASALIFMASGIYMIYYQYILIV
ncbi:hypothetical protein HYU10_03335 [Candidatus Woesearchaeota archaeon]|nr:hypothetical protein [Candidatus Woesearchaeota archaeon]